MARWRNRSRLARDPLKKLPPGSEAHLRLPHRWHDEAVNAGRKIKCIILAFEADRDGFWRADCGQGRSKYMSFMRPVCRSHESSGVLEDRPAGYWTSATLPHVLGSPVRRSI
jgi:hypothetical protein